MQKIFAYHMLQQLFESFYTDSCSLQFLRGDDKTNFFYSSQDTKKQVLKNKERGRNRDLRPVTSILSNQFI